MDNKELKDKIIKLLNDDYVEDKLGEESPNISADAVESIADDIVNLLPIHDVSCCDCKKELENANEAIKDMQDELNYRARS